MKKSLVFILLPFLVGMFSCRTDFDVNADWEDVTVVFGLLDQGDTAQYVRVTKTFNGDQDAYLMASQWDSLYYDSLSVCLEEYIGNNLVHTILLQKTVNEIIKEDGIFSSESNILYKTTEQLHNESQYKLRVYVPKYGKEATAITNLIHGMAIKYNFASPMMYMNLSNNAEIEISSAKNAIVYDVMIRFYFFEVYSDGTWAPDSIEWRIPSQYASSANGGEKIVFNLAADSFRKFLASRLAINPDIIRVPRDTMFRSWYSSAMIPEGSGAFDVFISMGGEDFNTYIEVNKPADGIVQERPAFSNISNGLGLFSCRNTKAILKKNGSQPTYDSLSISKTSRELNFIDSNGHYYDE